MSKYDINEAGQMRKGHEARIHLNFKFRKWGVKSPIPGGPRRGYDDPLRLQLSQDKAYVFVYNFAGPANGRKFDF